MTTKKPRRQKKSAKCDEIEIPHIKQLIADRPVPSVAEHAPEAKPKPKERPVVKMEAGVLGSRIPVKEGHMQTHKSEYLPKGHLSMIIVGRSGCGKSTLLREIIPQIANLSQVIVLTRVVGNLVYSAIKDWCEAQDPPIYFSESNDDQSATEELERCVAEKPEGTNGFIVFDDFTNLNSSRSDSLNRIQNTVYSMLRNFGYHNACLTQNPTNVPTLSRANANMRFMFPVNEVHGIRSIKHDWLQLTGHSPDEFDELYRFIKNSDHGFLLTNSQGADNRVFICLPGKTDGIQEVEFGCQKLSDGALLEDAGLRRLIGQLKEMQTKKSFLGRQAIVRLQDALEQYCTYLSRVNDVPFEDVRARVYDAFGV